MIENSNLKPYNFEKIDNYVFLSFIVLIFVVIKFNMLPLVFAGLITYVIIENINKLFHKISHYKFTPNILRIKSERKINTLSNVILISIITLFISIGAIYLYNFINSDNLNLIFNKINQIILEFTASNHLPSYFQKFVPDNNLQIKEQALVFLNEYFNEIKLAGQNSVKVILYITFGIILGSIISFQRINYSESNFTEQIKDRPIAKSLVNYIKLFKNCFDKIVIAQVKISSINTFLTSIYILIVLPIFNVELPFAKTIIIITFIAGLLPIVGNLISNTVIVTLSLGVNMYVAVASLSFLVIIHKLEYFIEAKIIGTEINAKIYEILLAMIMFEILFGIVGLIIAPIVYSFTKTVLINKKLV